MKAMLCLKNASHVVFFKHDDHDAARAYRKTHHAFKGRRIQHVLQAYPSRIVYGVEMERHS